jgi:hypothetical protein
MIPRRAVVRDFGDQRFRGAGAGFHLIKCISRTPPVVAGGLFDVGGELRCTSPTYASLACEIFMLHGRIFRLSAGLVLLSFLAASVQAEQRLADFRRVVIADDAGPVAKAAADELAHYVGRLVAAQAEPAKLDVVPWSKFVETAKPDGLTFFVGADVAERVLDKKLGPWQDEEWLLQTVPTGLVLAGSDAVGDPWSARTSAGSMLAVYTLLDDHLGCRWFWPGEFGEHVPRAADAVVPQLDVRGTPKFFIRNVQLGYGMYHTDRFRDEAKRWARRSRMGWVRSAVFGHSWFDAFNFRNDESFKAHPEWFALVNGEHRGPQMCTTEPAVIDHMVDFVLKGKTDIVNISPSDGGGFCQCERCQALDVPGLLAYDGKTVRLSDRIYTYANEVARRVRAKNPAKGVGIFAYTFYNKPPAKLPKLEPNVYVSFVYQSAAFRAPDQVSTWHESVDGWKRLGAKLVIREGWGNHYYFDVPMIHARQILDNVSEASRLGFVAAYGEGSKSFATMAPNYFALARMLWDPARDTTAVLPDFYRSAYGPAAEPMQKFFETYERSLDEHWGERDRNVDTSGIAYANMIGSWRRLLPTSVVDAADAHLREAERIAPAGEYADRVKFHRFGQDFTRVMLDLLETYRQLALLGVKLDTFSSVVKERREDPQTRAAMLLQAYELGERREQMLLEHRDWAGPDEGLYAFTNDAGLRQWHTAVKRELNIDKPSPLTKAALRPTK